MAVLYISEYAVQGNSQGGGALPIAAGPALATQTVAIGGASAQSSAFNASTRYIRVHTDAICSVLIGKDPTATTSSPRMAADQTEYFGVVGGDKIAVISNT